MTQPVNGAPVRRRKKVKGWQRVLFHWRFPVIIVLILMLLSLLLGRALPKKATDTAANQAASSSQQDAASSAKTKTQNAAFDDAVVDALQADENEIQKLVCLTAEDGNVTYNTDTDRVLLAFWSSAPDAFTKDKQTTLDSDTYAYADLELAAWGKAHSDDLKNGKTDRLCQLFGLPANGGGSTFVTAWVTPERIYRPAYQPDAQIGTMTTAFEENVDADFTAFFDAQIEQNYFTTPRPWTRLGYTYDWGTTDKNHYGVTEFVIPSGTKITVKDIFTNDETITKLRKGSMGA